MPGLAGPVPLKTVKIKRAVFRKRRKSNKVMARLACYKREEIHPTEYEHCWIKKHVDA